MKLNLVYHRFAHHAGPSGYSHIAHRLARRADVVSIDQGRRPRGRLAEGLAHRGGDTRYQPEALRREVAAARAGLARRPDVTHLLYADWDFRYLHRLPPRWRGGLVCTYHYPPSELSGRRASPALLAAPEALIGLSSRLCEHLRERAGGRDGVHFIPIGCDPDYWTPAPEGSGGSGCVFVGSHMRAFGRLERVIRLVGERDPSVRFDVVTKAHRAQRLGELPSVTARSGIPDDELRAAYRAAGLLVLPLTDAVAVNSLLEAMACGLPVVTSDVGGVRDYVDERCGRLLAADDVEGMAATVLELSRDHEQRAEMGRAARERARRFDWDHIVARHLAVYESVA